MNPVPWWMDDRMPPWGEETGHGWHRGDAVLIDNPPAIVVPLLGIITEVAHTGRGTRAQVKLSDTPRDDFWLPATDMSWTGVCLTRFPRTRRGWRRVFRQVTEMVTGLPERTYR